jgi:hypothetical protein
LSGSRLVTCGQTDTGLRGETNRRIFVTVLRTRLKGMDERGVTARTEFDSRTGGPERDIDWTFGDYSSLYAKERGLS